MEDKDHLKGILGNINQIDKSIDLEASIIELILKRENLKRQIARCKFKGILGLVISLILAIILTIVYSFPSSFNSLDHPIIKYASLITSLFILYIQLELGGFKYIVNLKNKTL